MVKNFMDLSGKVAVVMGGTSGIGAMLALGLAEAGADVVPTGRRQAELDAVCGKVEAAGRKTVRRTCDVQNRESIDALRDEVLATLGHVDILVNAAGITFRKPTKDVAEADCRRVDEPLCSHDEDTPQTQPSRRMCFGLVQKPALGSASTDRGSDGTDKLSLK